MNARCSSSASGSRRISPRAESPPGSGAFFLAHGGGGRLAAAVAEVRNAIAALLLGGVQRGVGGVEQLVRGLEAPMRLAGVSDAHRDGLLARHRTLHRGTQP